MRRAPVALTGSGVYYGSASTEAADCADADVYIVGGANSAGQAALFFCRVRQVRDAWSCVPTRSSGPMSHYLIEQLRAIDNITVRLERSSTRCTATDTSKG